MSKLEAEFNGATDLIGVLGIGSMDLSSILLVTPVKAVGYIGIGGEVGAFTASVVTRKKHLQVATQRIEELLDAHRVEVDLQNELLLAKESEIATLRGDCSKGFNYIELLNQKLNHSIYEVTKLQNQVDSLTVQNQSQKQLVEEVTGELDRLIAVARTAVEESLDERATRLSSLVTTKKEQYPKLAERLSSLLDEGNQLFGVFVFLLEGTPSKWDSLADLLSIYFCFNDDLGNVRIKAVQAIAKLTNQETQLELQDWQTANLVSRDDVEHLNKNYEAAISEFRMEYSKRFEGVYQFAASLEGQTQEDDKFVKGILAKMQELEGRIHQLSKPIIYPGATRTDMRIANIIISYFERLGIILDRAGSDFRGHQTVMEFIPDRTGRLVLASELNEHSERLEGLTHVLNKLEFKLDPETGLMTLLVRWANKPAADNTDLAKRLLTPLDEVVKKLVDNLSHKPTIRVMGATGEGKGVMVRYLLKFILANHSWYCRLHDPQHGSSEDHWGIPKVSKTGNELKQALKLVEEQMVSREADGWSVVTLDVLDEIDTHLEKKEKKESFIDLISRIRHLGMKLILIGQNPKVGRAGFEWSDMQQMNCIYMGASAFDAIETNPQLKPRKDKLTKDYITLSEHYEKVNEGLDDSEKYLFGLVVIPGITPLWVELPRPDSIEINSEKLLLGNSFTIPDSLIQLVGSNNSASASGNFGKTNRNSSPSAEAESLVTQGLSAIADKPDYVGVTGTVGKGYNLAKVICKKQPKAELRQQKDGRYYCSSCKKRLAKSDVEYR